MKGDLFFSFIVFYQISNIWIWVQLALGCFSRCQWITYQAFFTQLKDSGFCYFKSKVFWDFLLFFVIVKCLFGNLRPQIIWIFGFHGSYIFQISSCRWSQTVGSQTSQNSKHSIFGHKGQDSWVVLVGSLVSTFLGPKIFSVLSDLDLRVYRVFGSQVCWVIDSPDCTFLVCGYV